MRLRVKAQRAEKKSEHKGCELLEDQPYSNKDWQIKE